MTGFFPARHTTLVTSLCALWGMVLCEPLVESALDCSLEHVNKEGILFPCYDFLLKELADLKGTL